MKKHLKKITNQTVNELLNNEIIMPSTYFEKFNKNASTLEVNLEDDSFNQEMNKILIEEFDTIEVYMKSIMNNANIIGNAAKGTKKALMEKDIDSLTDIYQQMVKLEKEVKDLTNKIFIDDLTNTFNRKWIYNKYLNKEALLKEDGLCVLIDINDYNYIENEYGELLANNLLIFITRYLKKNLKEEDCNFKIARFFDNQFIIFVNNKGLSQLNNLIFNIKNLLSNTNLKSNSGLFIKANYEYRIQSYSKGQDSKDVFEALFDQLKDK